VALEATGAGLAAGGVEGLAGADVAVAGVASSAAAFFFLWLFFEEVSAEAAGLAAAELLAGEFVVAASPVAAFFLCLCLDFVALEEESVLWSDEPEAEDCAREAALKTATSTQRRAIRARILCGGFMRILSEYRLPPYKRVSVGEGGRSLV
jgi:hypothetical protein